ncbi:hypothetical protein FE257_000101 [Aspergillus nanangensis]|uniref:Uncharacterized protein n=1 Tax=Aspergillus nanangensis TaxID=2582783 RepID=A0AAD4GYS4_ASPNN|nr:hypothetical protein FE257_000101 [Aspergillus nanangensis]
MRAMGNNAGFTICLLETIRTLYLFGKSDIPAAVLPSMAVALVLAGPSSPNLIVKAFIWEQLHLLTFQVHFHSVPTQLIELTQPKVKNQVRGSFFSTSGPTSERAYL